MDFHTCRWVAEQLLKVIQPDALRRPEPIDTTSLVLDSTILGVSIRSASMREMGRHEGRYYEEDRIILLREDMWHALQGGCRSDDWHRARGVVSHEVSHHAIRDDHRVTNEEEDSWSVAGCLMMPCEMVRSLTEINRMSVSETFDVSPQFALAHLKRMKLADML